MYTLFKVLYPLLTSYVAPLSKWSFWLEEAAFLRAKSS